VAVTLLKVPRSTYRLQITEDWGLPDAAALVPYLHALGADWVYLSPVLAAEPGSTHGYDVVDHGEIDESRGGRGALADLAEAARAAGLGVLIDIVPNHVGVATAALSVWWWDVLARGRASEHADAFDIDWDAAGGKLRLPVLGDGDDEHAALRIEDGELRYHEHRFPIAEGTLTDLPGDDRTGSDPRAVHARQHYELMNYRRADAERNREKILTAARAAFTDPDADISMAEISRRAGVGPVPGQWRAARGQRVRGPEVHRRRGAQHDARAGRAGQCRTPGGRPRRGARIHDAGLRPGPAGIHPAWRDHGRVR